MLLLKKNGNKMKLPETIKAKPNIGLLGLVYSDGKNYSHLETNSNLYPQHECVKCRSPIMTITNRADICHECGYVYT